MSLEILKVCLVALLSQDTDQQTAEMDKLLNAPFEQTQLAACLQSYAVSPDEMQTMVAGGFDQAPRPKKDLQNEPNPDMMQTMVAGGFDQAPRPKKKLQNEPNPDMMQSMGAGGIIQAPRPEK